MGSVADGWSGTHTSPSSSSEVHSKRQKRMKICEETFELSPFYSKHLQDKNRQNKVNDHCDPFAVANWEEGINSAKFGSVTKEIEALLARRRERMKPCLMTSPILGQICLNSSSKNEASLANHAVLDDDAVRDSSAAQPIVLVDSDDEEPGNRRPFQTFQDIVLNKASENEASLKNHPIAVLNDDAVRDSSAAQPIVLVDSDDEEPGNRRSFQTFQDIVLNKASENEASLKSHPVAVLDDDAVHASSAGQPIVVIDSDDKEPGHRRPFQTLQNIVLNKPSDEFQMKHILEGDYTQGQTLKDGDASVADESNSRNDKRSVHVDEDVKSRKDNSVCDEEEDQSIKVKMNMHFAEEDGCMKDKGKYVVVDGSMEIKESRKDKSNILVGEGDECIKNTGDYVGEGCSMEIEESSKDKTNLHVAKEDECLKDKGEYVGVDDSMEIKDTNMHVGEENECIKDKVENVGIDGSMENEESSKNSDINVDGLADIWKEMNFALECSKDTSVPLISNESTRDGGEECDHSFLLKDDIGFVCRICGVISRGIETIIEYQYGKSTRSTRTYYREVHNTKNEEGSEIHLGKGVSSQDFSVAEIYAHPRHKKQMKPHQVEGFNFLLSNLMTETPGGCILAHAPGSGKTFMLISFIQSFMTKYPSARPLVVLPRGILQTWKKEFKRWQVEDLPLHDFYSVKADSRSQQLEVLKQWAEERSILFMGYKQFSSIVCDNDTSNISIKCQEILLTYPSILILDEGHTPRNQDTDVLMSLEKVQTPRKVVLSGTLYQNHVREVFTILNLVRPKFLRLETSKSIKKRILSRVPISSRKNFLKKCTDNEFYEMVEHTLVKDDSFRRKVTVIEDLREMTSKVLHYYKGDFLDELPGLVDFSVFLNLSPKQKKEISVLKKLANKFKISSDGGVIYVHPALKSLAKNTTVRERVDEEKIDEMLSKLDMHDGVKAKFYLNLLSLCEHSGEKLLVFGQYLLPLKFLERLTMKIKGWNPGREMFMITGDSGSEFRELSMDCFNNSPDARVFFGSIKACGEGISLVGASRIIILDVHLNPSVTRQAIGRAFRPGQTRKVYTYRLVAAGAPEEEDHYTCFRKESIAKMWFEWNEYCGHKDFEMETADVSNCGDEFLEMSQLNEDVAALYRR